MRRWTAGVALVLQHRRSDAETRAIRKRRRRWNANPLARSLYAPQIRALHAAAGRTNVHVVSAEALEGGRGAALTALVAFLGLPAFKWPATTIQAAARLQAAHRADGAAKYARRRRSLPSLGEILVRPPPRNIRVVAAAPPPKTPRHDAPAS